MGLHSALGFWSRSSVDEACRALCLAVILPFHSSALVQWSRDMLPRLSMSAASRRLLAVSRQIRAASTMKEAIVSRGPKVRIVDSPVPKPGPGQVVTKVIFSGSNPKDW